MRHRLPYVALVAASAAALCGCSLFGDSGSGESAARAEVYTEIADRMAEIEAIPEYVGTPESVKEEIKVTRENAAANASAEKRAAFGKKVEAVGSAVSRLPGIGGIIGTILGLGGAILILTAKKKPLSSGGKV